MDNDSFFRQSVRLWTVMAVIAALLFFVPGARAQGPNMMGNSGFEDGGLDTWWLSNGAPVSVVSGVNHTPGGNYSMMFAENYGNSGATTTVSVWPNQSYTTSIWVMGAGPLVLSVSDATTGTAIASVNITPSSSWQQINLPYTTPNTTTSVSVGIGEIENEAGTTYVDDVSTCVSNASTVSFNPSSPPAGWSMIFDSEFNEASDAAAGADGTIDINNTGGPGFQWYGLPSNPSTAGDTTTNMYTVTGGSLTLNNSPDFYAGLCDVLHTAIPDSNNSQGYEGTAFSSGTGLYAEISMACPNFSNSGLSWGSGWPSFWLFPLGLSGGYPTFAGKMPGYSGTSEYVENDIVEINPSWSPNFWSSTMHDWADWSSSVTTGGSVGSTNATIYAPVGANYTNYNTYGELWIPGTAANGWHGYRQAYFNGVPQQAVCWIGGQEYGGGTGALPIPSLAAMGSYLYSLGDQELYTLALGCTPGGTPTAAINYVHVYALSPSSSLHVVGGGGSGEGPYGGTPAAIPGTVQAENYDTGGQGVGYNVTSINGSANSYRSDGVDLETTTDTGGGCDLGWSAAGQWFNYTVNAATATTYTVSIRVANGGASNATLHLQNSAGINISGEITVAPTGGWQTWTTITASVALPAGQQVLKVDQDSGGYNMNWMSFTTQEGPYGGTAAAIPGTVQAENYDTGGQGVGYSAASGNGTANSYRSDGIDLEACSDTGGGYDLGWTGAGQWFNYTVNAATAGTYTVSFRIASPNANSDAFHLANAVGTNLTGSVSIPATGGYQTWATVISAPFNLPAGMQTLTLVEDSAGWNVNWMSFVDPPAIPSAPTGLTAVAGASGTKKITLTWTASSGAASYSVYRGTTSGGESGTAIATGVTTTTYTNTGLTAKTKYYYYVTAVNSTGASSKSNEASATAQ